MISCVISLSPSFSYFLPFFPFPDLQKSSLGSVQDTQAPSEQELKGLEGEGEEEGEDDDEDREEEEEDDEGDLDSDEEKRK